MSVIEIRKQRGCPCSFVGCKRRSYVVLVAVNRFNDAPSYYPECRQHLAETVTMEGWSDKAKEQWRSLI